MNTLFIFELGVFIVLGLLFGSFSTALIYRVPRKIDWGVKRSSCTTCQRNLSFVDLVPVFSWVIFRGKCRGCKKPISVLYPLVELCSAVLSVLIYLNYGATYEAAFLILALPFLLSLFVIDVKHMILPNVLVFILLIIGIARLFYFSTVDVFVSVEYFLITYVLGAGVFAFVSWFLGFVFTKILKKDALGFGDVKFFLVAGVWLGLHSLPEFMIASGVIAIVFALIWRIAFKTEVFPFGPALIISFVGILFWQGSFVV